MKQHRSSRHMPEQAGIFLFWLQAEMYSSHQSYSRVLRRLRVLVQLLNVTKWCIKMQITSEEHNNDLKEMQKHDKEMYNGDMEMQNYVK